MTQCPLCLGECPDGASKCRHCGEWLAPGKRGSGVDELAREAAGLVRAYRPWVRMLLPLALVAFVGAIGFMIWLLRSDGAMDRMHQDHDRRVDEMRREHQQRVEEMRAAERPLDQIR